MCWKKKDERKIKNQLSLKDQEISLEKKLNYFIQKDIPNQGNKLNH